MLKLNYVLYFVNSLTYLSYILVGLAAVCAAGASLFTLRYVGKVTTLVKKQDEEELDNDAAWPDVTVVVYSYNDAEGLSELLPTLINQDYPGVYDIVVVNDGADIATDELLTSLEKEHTGLYHTFTPRDTSNLSRKKLALMLGIKAARNDIMHLITSESRIPSDSWLKLMTRRFMNPETQIVIGYAYPDPACDTERGADSRQHDHLIDGVQYLSAAISGQAYRGDGDNLSYRRSLFFANKGFSRSLQLAYGDDDVFISEVATPENTRVEISTESQVSTVTDEPRKRFRHKKSRYNFTSQFGRQGALRRYSTISIILWGWLLVAVASICLSPLNPLIWIINAAIGAGLWIPTTMAWKKAATALHSTPFGITVPIALMLRPLRNLAYRPHRHDTPEPRFTWETV
ncbi:MAG: glycosyltransferase [Muribaculum sp.]|nr:glycosyltransferase [Muribaculum sp.]